LRSARIAPPPTGTSEVLRSGASEGEVVGLELTAVLDAVSELEPLAELEPVAELELVDSGDVGDPHAAVTAAAAATIPAVVRIWRRVGPEIVSMM